MTQFLVSISLFVNVEKAQAAIVEEPFSGCPGLFVLRFRDGHVGRPIGWAFVQRGSQRVSSWNAAMRDGTQIYAYWSNDFWGLGQVLVGSSPSDAGKGFRLQRLIQ